MNLVYDNYSLFIDKKDNISTKLLVDKNYLLLKAINIYGNSEYQYLEKLVNIWINMKYLNCRYNHHLEQEANKYFSNLV